jgi:hypothetical protein
MNDHQKIQFTSAGEEIIFRPVNRRGHVFIQSIWVIGSAILFYWSAPALQAYFEDGEILGAIKHLERFHLSARGMKAAIIGWCIFLAWWGLGGLYEIAKILRKRDRFLLRSDSLVVQRRNLFTRELSIFSYEPMALRLRSLDGALEAKTPNSSKVLTDCGTNEDRRWLLELLQQRYRAPLELPAITESIKEGVGTYIVEKRPDGVLRITSSGLSTVGCGVIAAVVCIGLIGLSIWLFSKGSGGAFAPLMFAVAIAFAGLGALNKRVVEASRGKLRVQWSSPVGKVLRRYVSADNMMLKFHFGEGSYERDSGSLTVKVTHRKKSTPDYGVVLLREEKDLDPDDEAVEDETDDSNGSEDFDGEAEMDIEQKALRYQEDLVLDVHGEGSEYTADHLMRLLSEATGFPIIK